MDACRAVVGICLELLFVNSAETGTGPTGHAVGGRPCFLHFWGVRGKRGLRL